MAKTWRILSIDGGGIRGLIPCTILMEIEKRTGRRIAELFDFIAGTSTGAIIGLATSLPPVAESQHTSRYSAEDILNFYLNFGPKVFKNSLFGRMKQWTIGGARYSESVFELCLKQYFLDTKFGDALNNVLVTSFNLESRMPAFFKSWDERTNSYYNMYELARASSAAPTYFRPAQLITTNGMQGFVDGGLICNNPSLTALVECMRYAEQDDSFLIVSLGTGKYVQPIPLSNAIHWRPIEWIEPILNICMDGAEVKTDYEMLQLSHLSNKLYYRFDATLQKNMETLDDASFENMRSLVQLGNEICQKQLKMEFDNLISLLSALSPQPQIKIIWSKLPESLQPLAIRQLEPKE